MEEIHDRARLVDASAFDPKSRAVSTTISRSQIEDVLRERDGQPELVLEVVQGGNGGTDARMLTIDWESSDLEELLRRAGDEDITLSFDEEELRRLLDSDVEAHGLREMAAVVAVAATTAAGAAAGSAAASTGGPLIDGGAGPSGTPIAMVSDAGSSGPVTTAAPQLISDAASSGPVQVAEASPLISDAASSGPVEVAAASPLISDAASSGPVQIAESPQLISDAAASGPVQTAEAAQLISDAASSGPVSAAASEAPQLVSDAATSGPVSTAEAAAATSSGGDGITLSAPDAREGALIGGIALFITAAGFAVRNKRRAPGRPA